MFGMTSVASDQSFADARILLNVVGMLSEPDRRSLAAQLQELAKGMEQIQTARAALSQYEAELLRREKQAAANEEALTKREAAAAEQEQKAQALLQRAEQAKAEVNALKDDLRQAWSQAA
jgi:hypothetical protein